MDLRLSAVKDQDSSFKALVGQSKALFAGLPFDLTATLGAQGQVAFTMGASNLNMGTLVCVFFDQKPGCASVDPLAPELIMDFLKDISFTAVELSYDSSKAVSKALGLTAVPDVKQVPFLSDIMAFLEGTFSVSFSTNEVMLKLAPDELAFGIFKNFTMSLGTPFTEPVQTTVSLEVVAAVATVGVKATLGFDSTIALPGVQDPVGFDAVATVAMSPDLNFGIAGRTTSSIVLKRFSFIEIRELVVAAEFGVSPLNLKFLKLYGAVEVFGVAGQAAFMWDRNAGDLAFMANVSSIDLQKLIEKWDIPLDLGESIAGFTPYLTAYGLMKALPLCPATPPYHLPTSTHPWYPPQPRAWVHMCGIEIRARSARETETEEERGERVERGRRRRPHVARAGACCAWRLNTGATTRCVQVHTARCSPC